MLIYEKDNKLNINFDNEVSEQPDLQIGKSGDKTQISVNGQSSGGGSFVIHVNEITTDNGTKYELDKTWQEISDAIEAGMHCCIVDYIPAADDSNEMIPRQEIIGSVLIDGGSYGLVSSFGEPIHFSADTKDGYPYSLLAIELPPNPGTIGPSDPGPIS